MLQLDVMSNSSTHASNVVIPGIKAPRSASPGVPFEVDIPVELFGPSALLTLPEVRIIPSDNGNVEVA